MAIERIVCANRPEWLARRRELGVGASEAAAVLGLSRFRSAAEVHYDKRGGKSREADEDRPAYLWWGLKLEPAIAERYAIETGRTVEDTGQYTIFRDTEKPWRYATLDRWVVDYGPLELKNARGLMRRYWSDGVPLEVQIQTQQQMAVMGAERASVAVLFEGSDFEYHDLARHQPFIDLLDARTREFWENSQRGIVPVDGDRRTRDIINEQHEAKRAPIVLPGELQEWDRKRTEASEAIKDAEKVKNEAESRIILALGEAVSGAIDGSGVIYKRTLVKGSTYTVERKDSHRLSRSEKR